MITMTPERTPKAAEHLRQRLQEMIVREGKRPGELGRRKWHSLDPGADGRGWRDEWRDHGVSAEGRREAFAGTGLGFPDHGRPAGPHGC